MLLELRIPQCNTGQAAWPLGMDGEGGSSGLFLSEASDAHMRKHVQSGEPMLGARKP